MSPRSALVFVTALVALAVAACMTPAPPAPPAPAAVTPPAAGAPATPAAAATPAPREPRGRVVIAQPAFAFQQLDPNHATAATQLPQLWPIYDGLTWVDRNGATQPGLASAWRSIDPRTWEFTLGAWTFHNGRAVTTDDVLGTIERARDPANRMGSANLVANIESVTASDPRTLRVITRNPDAVFPKLIGQLMIIPIAEFRTQGPALFNNPIGTGPFKLVSADFRTAVSYEAMPASFRSPRGTPFVRQIEFRLLPEPGSQAAALRTGEIDITTLPLDLAKLAWSAGSQAFEVHGTSTWSISLDTFTAPTSDRRVRHAINHAVNKQAINRALFDGRARPDVQLVGREVVGFNPALQPYAYDVARARQLLAEAGFPGGFTQQIVTLGILSNREIAEAVSADLRQIGINAPIEIQEVGVWTSAFLGPVDARRNRMLGQVLNWEGLMEPAPWSFYSSDRPLTNGRRWEGEAYERFERAYQAAKGNFNEAERGRAYQLAGQILAEEAPVLFLFQTVIFGAMKPGVVYTPGTFADALVTLRAP